MPKIKSEPYRDNCILILRLPEVMRRTGYKHATIYKMIKEGKFPKNYKIGPRAVGWNSAEIEEWIEARLMPSEESY